MVNHLSPHRSRLWVRLTPGLVVGGLCLWWTMRGLELPVVFQTLAMTSPAWVVAALGGVAGVALAKAARWGALYRGAGRQAPFWNLFAVLMAAQMVNVMLPIRLGELLRLGFMKRAGQPGALTLSTLVVEKALDLIAAGLIAVSVVALAVAPAWLLDQAGRVLGMGLGLGGSVLLVWCLRDRLERYLAAGLTWAELTPLGWFRSLLRWVRSMLEAFGMLTRAGALARVTLWTAGIWLLSLLTMLALFAALGLPLPVTAAMVMLLAVTSSNILPSPPGLVGVMHLVAVLVLGQYGITQPVAVGFGIVLNLVTVVPLIVLGSWVLWPSEVSKWRQIFLG